MNELIVSIIFALVIGAVITAITVVKNPRVKALIYSLPIPMTVALITTGGEVDGTHIMGVALVTAFLWLVMVLYVKGIHIIVADIVAALSYVAVGYVLVTFVSLPVYVVAIIYAVLWGLFAVLYKHPKAKKAQPSQPAVHPAYKFSAVSAMAFLLLSLKNVLSGVVVTFPFSGVFAVVETKHMLRELAVVFTRNSLGIVGFFVTIYALGELHLALKIAAGWAAYLIVLRLASCAVPLR